MVHLAAMAGVRPSLLDPLHYRGRQRARHGADPARAAARKRPETRFVFASSSSVYGGNTDVPFRRCDDVHQPVSPYAATKRAGELLCTPTTTCTGSRRPACGSSRSTGPRQRPGDGDPQVRAHDPRGEPLPFYGDGSRPGGTTPTSTTSSTASCAPSIAARATRSTTSASPGRRPWRSSSGGSSERPAGVSPGLDRQPMQPGDVVITYADVSKAREKLGLRQPIRPSRRASRASWPGTAERIVQGGSRGGGP